jgi:MoaA/NifB/PqqE/SkfB family radical SAM enzyme
MSVRADDVIAAPAEEPFGYALRPGLLRLLRSGFDAAWAVVGDLGSPKYRRAALLLRLARAADKCAIGPAGDRISLREWLLRSRISLGPLSLAEAALRSLAPLARRARAARLLHRGRPPWGFKRVNIGISDRCNQRCLMCSEHSPCCAAGGRRMAAPEVVEERDFGLMRAEIYGALIQDLRAMGGREIELCGLGEPLLHPEAFEFLRRAKSAGLWVRLVTNASLLTQEKATDLVRLGLDQISISLNAATPQAYAEIHGVAPAVFSRVLANLRALASSRAELGRSRPQIEVSFVVQAANYAQPADWVELMAGAGADIVSFSPLGAAPPGASVQLSPEQFEAAKKNVAAAVELARSKALQVQGNFGALAARGSAFSADVYARVPCYIGYIFALITASGRIHPCCACERVVGNINDGGFARAWRGDAYRRFREDCLDLPNRPPSLDGCACMSCPYAGLNLEFHQRLHGR